MQDTNSIPRYEPEPEDVDLPAAKYRVGDRVSVSPGPIDGIIERPFPPASPGEGWRYDVRDASGFTRTVVPMVPENIITPRAPESDVSCGERGTPRSHHFHVEVSVPPPMPDAAPVDPTKAIRFVLDLPGKVMKRVKRKRDWSLMPLSVFGEIIDVMQWANERPDSAYTPGSWREMPDWREAYSSALLRHLDEFQQGRERDHESNLRSLAHAGSCIAIMIARSQMEEAATREAPAR